MPKIITPKRKPAFGFTLAELLISLAILGVIATFTIPKILSAQQNAADSAKAKEAMATISAAYQAYQQDNTVTASTTSASLTPYLNYLAIDTSSTIDDTPTTPTVTCNSPYICMKLHNGAMLAIKPSEGFNGMTANNGWWFLLDPDGVQNASKPSIAFFLYPNGRITTTGQCNGSVTSTVMTYPCDPVYDPSWFSF